MCVLYEPNRLLSIRTTKVPHVGLWGDDDDDALDANLGARC